MPPQPSPPGSHKQSLASVRVQLVQNLSPAHVTKYPTSGQNSSKFFEDNQKSIFKASFDQDCTVNNRNVCPGLWREKLPS